MAMTEAPGMFVGEQKAAGRSLPMPWIWLLMLTGNVLLVFVIIPSVSAHLKFLYSQDQYNIDGYSMLAENIAAGNGYRFFSDTAPTLMREPGFPLLLAGIIHFFGKSVVAVQIVNFGFIAGSAFLLGALVRRLTNQASAVNIALLILFFHPGILIAETRAGVECLLAFLFTASILLMYRAISSDRWSDYFVAGLVLGLAVLVRSTPILFPVLLLGYRLIFERREAGPKVILRNFAVLMVSMLIAMSPWIVRNYRVTGHFVPTASVLGVSAHAGQYICEHIGENRPWFLLDREASRERGALAAKLGYKTKEGEIYYQFFYRTQDELDFSSYLAHEVASKYISSPRLCLKCMSANLVNFWIAGKTWRSKLLDSIIQVPFVACVVWGLVVFWRRDKKLAGLIALFIAYLMLVSMPILAQARYSVPLIPLMAAPIAYALVRRAHPSVAQ